MTPQDRPRLLRRRLAAVLVVLVLAAAGSQLAIGSVFGLFASTTSNPTSSFSANPCFVPVAVAVANFSFTPGSLTIAAGCSVTWTVTSSTKHSSTSTTGIWDSGQLAKDATFTRQFNSSGTFPYLCSVHPGSMQATITVT
jgi:plastocyanin